MRRIIAALLAFFPLLATSCSRKVEAKTREDQESYFQAVFEFDAPSTIAEIRYMDVYQRNLLDGVYGQWLRCSYDKNVFERILKERAYRLCTSGLYCDVQPEWWPKEVSPKVALYTREQRSKSGAASFQEYLWHDKNSNYIYFYKIQGF